jgi:hypothetical protein
LALVERSSKVRFGDEETKKIFVYVSRGGFTDNCIEYMDRENIIHWDLKDIEKILWG